MNTLTTLTSVPTMMTSSAAHASSRMKSVNVMKTSPTTIYSEVLFDYQKLAAERIAIQQSVLLADQPGLGKTLEVLSALELADLYRIGKNILIITPIINAQTAWVDSIKRFVEPRYDVNVLDISKGSVHNKRDLLSENLQGLCNIVVANHNAIDLVDKSNRVDTLDLISFDAIIIDESHMVLPIRDHRQRTNFWQGLLKIKFNDNCMRVAISGTPDRGKLENRYGTWLFLDPWNTTVNRWDWLGQNFHMYEQKVAKNRTVKMVGALKSQVKWAELDEQMMIRRTKGEVLQELPPKQYIDIELELSEKQLKDYIKVRDEDLEPMVFATRARQLADCQWDKDWEPWVGGKSAKLDWLAEWLDSRGFIDGSLDGKVVIASQFSKVLHWLQAELNAKGIATAILDGSTSGPDRISIQERFQDTSDPLRIVLLSGQMGVGITLDAADDLIMFDSPYDPDRIEQIEDRIHRASNMHNVTIWNLIAKATIDQIILAKVSKRYQITRKMLDGARGVSFEREVMQKLFVDAK